MPNGEEPKKNHQEPSKDEILRQLKAVMAAKQKETTDTVPSVRQQEQTVMSDWLKRLETAVDTPPETSAESVSAVPASPHEQAMMSDWLKRLEPAVDTPPAENDPLSLRKKLEKLSQELKAFEEQETFSEDDLKEWIDRLKAICDIANQEPKDQELLRTISFLDRRLAVVRKREDKIKKALNCYELAIEECGKDILCGEQYFEEDIQLAEDYCGLLLRNLGEREYTDTRCVKLLNRLKNNLCQCLTQKNKPSMVIQKVLSEVYMILFLKVDIREYAVNCMQAATAYAEEQLPISAANALLYLRRGDVIKQLAAEDGYTYPLIQACIDLYRTFEKAYRQNNDIEEAQRVAEHIEYYQKLRQTILPES